MDGAAVDAVGSLLEQAIGEGAFPGASWGVLQRGQVLAIGAAGRFTYEAASPRVMPETVYDLASVSKVVATTAMAMLLHQRGRLDLEMPLGDVLPGFVVAAGRGPGSGWGRRLVTLRLLLAHASGLPGYAPLYLKYSGRRAWRSSDAAGLMRDCLHMPLEAAPGSRAEYSDIGFILLGKALEVLAGEGLDAFCRREVFAPLGMEGTLYRPAAGMRGSIPPTEQDISFRQRVIQGEVHDENCWVLGGCAGHAGLFAPVGDLLRFAGAVLGAEAGRLTIFETRTARLFASRVGVPAGSSRALGWDTPSAPSSSGQSFGRRSIGHLGYTGTSLWLDPERDLGVVLLTNRTWPNRENRKIQEVRPKFHDLIARLLGQSGA